MHLSSARRTVHSDTYRDRLVSLSIDSFVPLPRVCKSSPLAAASRRSSQVWHFALKLRAEVPLTVQAQQDFTAACVKSRKQRSREQLENGKQQQRGREQPSDRWADVTQAGGQWPTAPEPTVFVRNSLRKSRSEVRRPSTLSESSTPLADFGALLKRLLTHSRMSCLRRMAKPFRSRSHKHWSSRAWATCSLKSLRRQSKQSRSRHLPRQIFPFSLSVRQQLH